MTTTQVASEIIKELERTIGLISEDEAEKFVSQILQAKKIFVAGAGRSGLMGKAFTMRMMHMGLDAFVVGETVTPSLTRRRLINYRFWFRRNKRFSVNGRKS